MDKQKAIEAVYQIATLTHPTVDVIELLRPLPFERTLDLLLILRQSPKPVKSPANFLRRAIQEGWTAETLPENIDRKVQRINQRSYERKGYDPETARIKALESAKEY